jgi:fumarylpyruvate hydrolase
VDKSVERPFYFTKSLQTLAESGATVTCPPESRDHQHEIGAIAI